MPCIREIREKKTIQFSQHKRSCQILYVYMYIQLVYKVYFKQNLEKKKKRIL